MGKEAFPFPVFVIPQRPVFLKLVSPHGAAAGHLEHWFRPAKNSIYLQAPTSTPNLSNLEMRRGWWDTVAEGSSTFVISMACAVLLRDGTTD
jgi:hypothetical protein